MHLEVQLIKIDCDQKQSVKEKARTFLCGFFESSLYLQNIHACFTSPVAKGYSNVNWSCECSYKMSNALIQLCHKSLLG